MTGLAPCVAALVLIAIVIAPGSARADHLRGVLAPIEEQGHEVTLTLHRGYAVWEAERRFVSEGAGQAIVHFGLPDTGRHAGAASAVPVGLSLRGPDGWRAGELEDAESAERTFNLGGGPDEAAALLAMGFSRAEAILRIAGMQPGVERQVRYRMLIPVFYDEGRYRLRLESPSEAQGPTLEQLEQIDGYEPRPPLPPVIRPHGIGGQLAVDGQPWPEGEPFPFRPGVEVSLRPTGAEGWKIDGGLAVVPFGEQFLTHARLELTPRLSEVPRNARVVVIVDSSRSISAEVGEGLRAAARAYLGHLPDARVEVIAFDRRPRQRYGRFVTSAMAREDLARWAPSRRNGSEIGEALALAEALLAAEPKEAPKRLVVFTDALTRQGLAIDRLAPHLELPGLVAHLVKLDPEPSDSPRLRREQGGAWDALVEPSGGLAWRATVSASSDARSAIERMTLRLARPVDLLDLEATTAPFGSASPLCAPFQMGEGEGVSLLAILDQPLPWLRIEGKLWREPVSATLPVVDRETAVWAALAFGSRVLPFDATSARKQLARRGGAVTHSTSYLVGHTAEPPPPERGGAMRFGRRISTSTSCGSRRTHRVSKTARRWLEERLREALYSCGAMRQSATMRLETTGPEVVSVGRISVDRDGESAAQLQRCLDRAAWSLALPEKLFAGRAVVEWELDLRPIFE